MQAPIFAQQLIPPVSMPWLIVSVAVYTAALAVIVVTVAFVIVPMMRDLWREDEGDVQ